MFISNGREPLNVTWIYTVALVHEFDNINLQIAISKTLKKPLTQVSKNRLPYIYA